MTDDMFDFDVEDEEEDEEWEAERRMRGEQSRKLTIPCCRPLAKQYSFTGSFEILQVM